MKGPVTMAKDFLAGLAGARDAISQLHAADVALRQQLGAEEAERGRLFSAKAPKPEVFKSLDVELQKLAAEWIAQRGPAVVDSLSGAIDVTPAGEIRGIVRYSSLTDAFGPWLSPLAALAPDMVREGITALIDRTPYQEGPPMSERAALVAEVDRKIEAIVKDHADLVDNAALSGIMVAHLPATVGRRAQAAQARKRWEDDQSLNRDYYKRNPNARPPEPEAAP